MNAAIIMNERMMGYNDFMRPHDNCKKGSYTIEWFGRHKPYLRDLEHMADVVFTNLPRNSFYCEVTNVAFQWINEGAYGYVKIYYLYC